MGEGGAVEAAPFVKTTGNGKGAYPFCVYRVTLLTMLRSSGSHSWERINLATTNPTMVPCGLKHASDWYGDGFSQAVS